MEFDASTPNVLSADDLSAVSGGNGSDFWNDPLLPSEWDADTGSFAPSTPSLPDTTVQDLYGMDSALGDSAYRYGDDFDYDGGTSSWD